jgi:hypothetical protein
MTRHPKKIDRSMKILQSPRTRTLKLVTLKTLFALLRLLFLDRLHRASGGLERKECFAGSMDATTGLF